VVKEVEKKERSKGKLSLKEKIKEDRSTKNMDHGQLNKRKNPPTDSLEHLTEKKEEQVGEALKIRVVGTRGPRVLVFRVLTLWPRSKVV
jgi:hypothetical protein